MLKYYLILNNKYLKNGNNYYITTMFKFSFFQIDTTDYRKI